MRRFAFFALGLLVACSTPQFGLRKIDEPMPKLAGTTLQGESFDAADYRGKVLVINFWASWCAPCREEAPILEATWERLQNEGVQFVGVDSRDQDAAGRAFVKEFGITYPSVKDPSGKVAFEFGINAGLPGTVVVNREGRMVYRLLGQLEQKDLDQMIAGAGGPAASPS